MRPIGLHDQYFRFADWIPYEHRVKANVKDIDGNYKVVPVPPNQVSQISFFLRAWLCWSNLIISLISGSEFESQGSQQVALPPLSDAVYIQHLV